MTGLQNGSIASHNPPRTLLLAPPSVSSHPEALTQILEAHDRNATDIQMLDRLALGLVSLPSSTYEVVLLLSDAAQMSEALASLDRTSMVKVVESLRPEGQLRRQNGEPLTRQDQTEAILAGLVANDAGTLVKPATSSAQTVTLNFGRKKANAAAIPAKETEAANTQSSTGPTVAGKRKIMVEAPGAPAGVGFVDFSDDFDDALNNDDDDDEEFPTKEELLSGDTIDPDTLLTEEDRQKPIILPEACKPNGKRRRACKDCSCGLKERIELEDAAKRAAADKGLATLKLGTEDLNEIDFTVKGKVGSCGNCALGDAFRCDGCPYIGLPAFKPGEEVRILNNDVQL